MPGSRGSSTDRVPAPQLHCDLFYVCCTSSLNSVQLVLNKYLLSDRINTYLLKQTNVLKVAHLKDHIFKKKGRERRQEVGNTLGLTPGGLSTLPRGKSYRVYTQRCTAPSAALHRLVTGLQLTESGRFATSFLVKKLRICLYLNLTNLDTSTL